MDFLWRYEAGYLILERLKFGEKYDKVFGICYNIYIVLFV